MQNDHKETQHDHKETQVNHKETKGKYNETQNYQLDTHINYKDAKQHKETQNDHKETQNYNEKRSTTVSLCGPVYERRWGLFACVCPGTHCSTTDYTHGSSTLSDTVSNENTKSHNRQQTGAHQCSRRLQCSPMSEQVLVMSQS